MDLLSRFNIGSFTDIKFTRSLWNWIIVPNFSGFVEFVDNFRVKRVLQLGRSATPLRNTDHYRHNAFPDLIFGSKAET